ncbi:copper amine oxidase N-terminal domain-containing protein [Desulfofundulus thermocisternus]|uniref:copper amine oxidase N-terminal domain-containing protein n=1 Tax=Desulfofundulus thermocisternus TaxID=42471 RepID=UPI00048466D1|nr:copper amine oxidase N-terminal domain-containing protein [Desulfofundulus thermocisternus]
MAFKSIRRLMFIASFVLLMSLSFCLGNIYANEKIRLFIATHETNGEWKEVSCNPSPIIVNNRVFVPLRFIAENLGAEVKWNDEQNAVYIKSAEVIAQEKAQEAAKKEQEELNKMFRHGKVISVEPDKLTMNVEKGGGDVGRTITITINEYTSVQVGMRFVNKPGEKIDLTKWFKPGDTVGALVKEGQAKALGRELRPGEQQP